MLLSRGRPQTASSSSRNQLRAESAQKSDSSSVPDFQQLLSVRDYSGCVALLQHEKRSGKESVGRSSHWIAFCLFHLFQQEEALAAYRALLEEDDNDETKLNVSVCLFYLGEYDEARLLLNRLSAKAKNDRLFARLWAHLTDKEDKPGKEDQIRDKLLDDDPRDQLCTAALHFMRQHFQEAIDVYKRLLLEHRDWLALNVYIALCYYKLDYYDVSQEVLVNYLQNFPESVVARNLKACNHFRLFNGKAAEQELRDLIDGISPSFSFAKDLIRHNLVVFRNGDGALQVWPQLLDVLPEATLNLAIFYLKNDQLNDAHAILSPLEATLPAELILKGVVSALLGQQQQSRDLLKIAQQSFQRVGQSASECDTIAGRQAMSACFFLLKQYEDVLLYLSSIKSYFYSDDTFNANFGQAKAARGQYREAEPILEQIQSDRVRNDFVVISWLARTYIANRKAEKAWLLYTERQNPNEAFQLLQLIANDTYRMGQFLVSCRAFDALQKAEPNPEFWEGKRGAAAGQLQMVVAGKEPKETMSEILKLMRGGGTAQASQMMTVLKNYCRDNKIT